jgi:FAD/FMN-containing dehydrogenase
MHIRAEDETPPWPSRRRVLVGSLAGIGLFTLGHPQPSTAAPVFVIDNVTKLFGVIVSKVEAPTSLDEICKTVRDWPGKIAVGGGRYSMGGQIAVLEGLHLDLRQYNKVVWFRPSERRVRVQAGMTWRALQEVIDPHGLSVKIMQSYANFTVGGSIAVNCHGRYVGAGPIANSIQALKIVLADGSQIEATPTENVELFSAAIGGYGAIGVIAEVELRLDVNSRIERVVSQPTLGEYVDYFRGSVQGDAKAVLHNADLLPPHFDVPIAITWRRSDAAPTERRRLRPRGQGYWLDQEVIRLVADVPSSQIARQKISPAAMKLVPKVCWRNFEASLDVASLEPKSRENFTFALQEYFVPPENFSAFASGMAGILARHRANVLNVSIRHSPADGVSLLTWAKTEVFCFVIYFRQRTTAAASVEVGNWTRELITLALSYGGRYYLPYQPHATNEQFLRAYPEVEALWKIKNRVDPAGKFSNELWSRYGPLQGS